MQIREPASAFSHLLSFEIEITKDRQHLRALLEWRPNFVAQRFDSARCAFEVFGSRVKLPNDFSAALFVGAAGKQVLDRVVDDLQRVEFFSVSVAQSRFGEHEFTATFANFIK